MIFFEYHPDGVEDAESRRRRIDTTFNAPLESAPPDPAGALREKECLEAPARPIRYFEATVASIRPSRIAWRTVDPVSMPMKRMRLCWGSRCHSERTEAAAIVGL